MWTHPIFLIGSAVVGVVMVVAASYTHYRQLQQQQHAYEYVERRIPKFERRVLGPCGICEGDVSIIDGYRAECGHYLHYTCQVHVTRPLNSGVPIDTPQICKACPQPRPRNPTVLGPCGICKGDASVSNSDRAECGHYLHYRCQRKVTRPLNTGVPIDSPPICMACSEQSMARTPQGQTNTGLRNRSMKVRECVNCTKRISNEEQNIRTMVCGHHVHEPCWERMQNSASPTCPKCMEAALDL